MSKIKDNIAAFHQAMDYISRGGLENMTKEEIANASTWFLVRMLEAVPETEEEERLIRKELSKRAKESRT
jgi:hypothetical protein